MSDKTMPTPGPWRVEEGTTLIWGEYERDPIDGFLVKAGIPVAKCDTEWRSWGRSISDEEHDANARLIAAAGTAAHTLEQNGYDHLALLKALPALATYARMTLGRDDFWSFVQKSAEQVDAGKEGA